MHFLLSSISFLLMLMTFVQSAPTASLDAATLLKNAQEAQKLNAQFQNANNSTTTGSCTNGDTTCVKDAIATCVNGQFATSNSCPATQQCFALPSVKSNGTIIACTSEKSAQSLFSAAGATGDVTGSGSGAPASSINPAAASPTLSGSAAIAAETAVSMDADCITSPTSTPTTGPSESVVTVTVTLIPSVPTTLPPVTRTLSPDQASSALSSLLAQGGSPAPTAEPDCSDEPSEALTSAVSASATDIPLADSTAVQSAASKITSSASSSATSAAAIANGAGSSVPGYGAGGYSGY